MATLNEILKRIGLKDKNDAETVEKSPSEAPEAAEDIAFDEAEDDDIFFDDLEADAPEEDELIYTWRAPAIECSNFYWDLQEQTHVLIGGTTGAGKSNFLEGFIHSCLANFPDETNFILIDPKMTALKKYRKLPHTIEYAIDGIAIEHAIAKAHRIMYQRYESLLDDDYATDYEGSDIWVIIDEYAGLKEIVSKDTMKALEDIACKGRAAKVHIMFCTQRPTSEVITGLIKANVTATVGLKTSSEQESRNLVGENSCKYIEPKVEAIYNSTTTAGDNILIHVPYSDPEVIKETINFWKDQAKEHTRQHMDWLLKKLKVYKELEEEDKDSIWVKEQIEALEKEYADDLYFLRYGVK